MPDQREIAEAFARQGRACRALGSPFTGHLCERLPVVLAQSDGPVAQAVATWPLDLDGSALALRLTGVLHRLVRAGLAPDLAALYPPQADTGPALDAALRDALGTHGGRLVEWLGSAPQTNEVARSAILLGGLLTIAQRTGHPLALREIGSSAGVNLSPDAYIYDFGAGRGWCADEDLDRRNTRANIQLKLSQVHVALFERNGDPGHLDTAQLHAEAAQKALSQTRNSEAIARAESQCVRIAALDQNRSD